MFSSPVYNILERISPKSGKRLYRAERCSDGEKVILKIFDAVNSKQYSSRIIDEYESVSRLTFTGIPKYSKLETFNDHFIVEMENVEGLSFEEYLQLHGINIGETLTIAIAIADILQFFL